MHAGVTRIDDLLGLHAPIVNFDGFGASVVRQHILQLVRHVMRQELQRSRAFWLAMRLRSHGSGSYAGPKNVRNIERAPCGSTHVGLRVTLKTSWDQPSLLPVWCFSSYTAAEHDDKLQHVAGQVLTRS